MSDTPRVDEIALRHSGQYMSVNEAHAQFNDLLDLARQLERELAEANSVSVNAETIKMDWPRIKWCCLQCSAREWRESVGLK